MKMRLDFVSNSSSSSFVMFGTKISNSELEKLFPDSDDIQHDAFGNTDLQYVEDYEDKAAYVGMSPVYMKDGETLRNFKEQIAVELTKIVPSFNNDVSKIEFFSGIDADGYIQLD